MTDYLTSLEEDLEKYTTGHFRYLLHELLRTKRCESTEINYSTSDADARKLYHAGMLFIRILISTNKQFF